MTRTMERASDVRKTLIKSINSCERLNHEKTVLMNKVYDLEDEIKELKIEKSNLETLLKISNDCSDRMRLEIKKLNLEK